MDKLWRAICPIRQYEDKLDLYCNSLKKGHTHLVWYKVEDPANKKEADMKSPFMTINGLEEGEYVFCTRDEESYSVRLYVTILKETVEESVKRIEQYVDNINQYHMSALQLLREHLKVKPKVTPISHLIALYRGSQKESVNKQKAFFQLIASAQYCDNNRSLRMNKENEAQVCINNTSQFSIEVSPMVTRLIMYRIVGGKKIYYLSIANGYQSKHTPQLVDDGEYMIEVYAGNDLVGVYYHFSGNAATKQWLWESQCETADKISEAKEQLINLPASFSFFSEEEQQRILLERSKNPFDSLVERPTVMVNKNSVDVGIADYSLLTSIGNFYVVAKEPDQLFANGFDRKELITGPTVSFSKAKHLLSDTEEYYFYIQDDNKNLVSKIELVALTDANYDDYKESVRQLELYDYSKRLIPLVDYRIETATEVIKELLEVAKSDADVNSVNIQRYLISKLNANKHLHYFNGAVNTIMEDKIGNALFSQLFFPNGIKYDRALDKFVFPPKDKKYVLVVNRISINSNEIITDHYDSELGAIEVQTRGADYFIFQAIDKQTYRRSGYVFVNTTKYNFNIANWNIQIEVI